MINSMIGKRVIQRLAGFHGGSSIVDGMENVPVGLEAECFVVVIEDASSNNIKARKGTLMDEELWKESFAMFRKVVFGHVVFCNRAVAIYCKEQGDISLEAADQVEVLGALESIAREAEIITQVGVRIIRR